MRTFGSAFQLTGDRSNAAPHFSVRILGKSNWVNENVFLQLHEYFKAFEKSLIKKNNTPFFF